MKLHVAHVAFEGEWCIFFDLFLPNSKPDNKKMRNSFNEFRNLYQIDAVQYLNSFILTLKIIFSHEFLHLKQSKFLIQFN